MLVISPLISIITNQIASLKKKGVTAAYAGDEDVVIKEAIKMGRYQLVFISPESLFCTIEWRRVLCTATHGSHLVGVVIDEAHCIKKWYNILGVLFIISYLFYCYCRGETFRREFSQLGELRHEV